MSTMKKVLVACGTGIATSTAVLENIREHLVKEEIRAELYQCKTSELKSQVSSLRPDLVVSTTQVSEDLGVTVLNGLPFLTGIGSESVMKEIVQRLKN
jgi:PTS system galactitol-specific IIB component